MRILFLALVAGIFALQGHAQVVRAYEYDALGRLVKVIPSTGNSLTYTFDAADNRVQVVAGAGTGPTAVDDYIVSDQYVVYGPLGVLWNDTDPDLPSDTLTVTSVSLLSANVAYHDLGGEFYILDPPTLSICTGGEDVCFLATAGGYSISYTIEDTLGNESTAVANVCVFYADIPVSCP